MTMTDPIADMLTRLRNANTAHHDTVSMPHSKIKANIAKILEEQGYIVGSSVADATVGKDVTDLAQGDHLVPCTCGHVQQGAPRWWHAHPRAGPPTAWAW